MSRDLWRAAIAAHRFDVVLLDLEMPELDGIGVLEALAKLRCGCAIIVASGLDERLVGAAVRIGRSLGLQMLEPLAKPFQLLDLRARLARHHTDVDGAFWQWNDAWLNPAFRGFDMRAECSRITAPVLSVEASKDSLSTWWKGTYTLQEYHDRLKNIAQVRIACIEQAGHMLQHDQPQALAELIEDFLA
jgi:pimeloyl-ACP methyl ester carboxylesterase